MSQNYKAVFYDWDGCAIQSLDIWVNAYKKVLAKESIFPSTHQIISVFGNWEACRLLGHSDSVSATREVVDCVNKEIKKAPLYPDIIKTFACLHKMGIRLALLTSTLRKTIESTHAYQQISSHCDLLLTAEDVTKHKPDPQIVNKALDYFGIECMDAFMVGDSAKDIKAAKAAGVNSVLFNTDEHQEYFVREELIKLKPTYVISAHPKILERITHI